MPWVTYPTDFLGRHRFEPSPAISAAVMKGHSNYYWIFIFGLALALFLIATLGRLSIPLAEWDHVILSAAADWSRGVEHIWLFDHPPLYPAVLAIVYYVFGEGALVARSMNIGFVLLTALCLYGGSRKVFDSNAALWALVLFLTNPVSIQGVSSLDMADISMLPLLFLLTAWALRYSCLRPTAGRTWLLGACLGVCMWAKVSATIAWMSALAVGFGAVWLLSGRRTIGLHGVNLIAGCILGLSLYLATSFLVLNGLWGTDAFLFPLRAAYAAVMDRGEPGGAAAALTILYSLVRIAVWFSPYWLLIFGLALWAAFREYACRRTSESLFSIWIGAAAAFFCLVHFLIGGANYGFPRYHSAIFPVMCMLAGRFLSAAMPAWRMRAQMVFGLSIVGTAALAAIVVPDPLFFLNIQLKGMLLQNEGLLQLADPALRVFLPLYGLPLFVAVSIHRAQHRTKPEAQWALLCAFGLLATTLSLDLQHVFASYRTTVQYGAVGKEELVRTVREHLSPGDRILATPEFIWELRELGVPRVDFEELRSKQRFMRFVKQYSPAAIIGGWTVSSLEHLRWMLSEETGNILSETYRPHRVGTYFYWLREDADRALAAERIAMEK